MTALLRSSCWQCGCHDLASRDLAASWTVQGPHLGAPGRRNGPSISTRSSRRGMRPEIIGMGSIWNGLAGIGFGDGRCTQHCEHCQPDFEMFMVHAAAFNRFLASMARTNLSHLAMPARFSTM